MSDCWILVAGFWSLVIGCWLMISGFSPAVELKSGQSVIVFPQSTRDTVFNPENFNSLGIKLAKKNKVPVIPLALKTDFWTSGKIFKDFGPLDVSRKIFFEFGESFEIKGSGKEEHQRVVEFIKGRLEKWRTEDI